MAENSQWPLAWLPGWDGARTQPWLGWDGARTRDPGASELESTSWMPAISSLTAVLARASYGVHYSTRSALAPLAQEPPVSSTLDVEAGREDELEQEAVDAAEKHWEEGEESVRPLQGKLSLADYPARKRSQEDMLPLTVEKRMMELKQKMWGEVQGGLFRQAWKESFASQAQQNHDARVTRANQRCCPTEALNALVSVCVTVFVLLCRLCLLHLSCDERGYAQKYRSAILIFLRSV